MFFLVQIALCQKWLFMADFHLLQFCLNMYFEIIWMSILIPISPTFMETCLCLSESNSDCFLEGIRLQWLFIIRGFMESKLKLKFPGGAQQTDSKSMKTLLS